MRISDWSSDVCSSDLRPDGVPRPARHLLGPARDDLLGRRHHRLAVAQQQRRHQRPVREAEGRAGTSAQRHGHCILDLADGPRRFAGAWFPRSEEQTSELQSLMRISYAVFCLTKKKTTISMYNTN